MEPSAAPTTATETEPEAVAAAGPELGFTSLEDEVRVDALPLRGELPSWLEGSLLRTGPSKFEAGERSFNHWFDGQAMLHRFGIGAGSVSYASRFLRGQAYEATARGEIAFSEFATDPCRGLFKRVMAIFDPKLSDNANVNLVKLGERYIAMTETPIPVHFDAETLATGRRRLRRAGHGDDRASAPRPAERRDAQLRGEARRTQRVPLLPARPRGGREAARDRLGARPQARLHALLRAQRAVADPRRVPVRRRPEEDRALRTPLHRELPLGARARHPRDALRPP